MILLGTLVVLYPSVSAQVVAVLAGTAPTPENRVEQLATRLKCPVCESESIADSPAQVARDSYDLIAERVAEVREEEAAERGRAP